jgi:ABC-2 type transport system ATP-binding protein
MLKQKASTLSGGQKRRLNIAIGLLNDPDILFFDEPTVGIDPESRNEILETIMSFKKDNKTVVYTSHYMPEIEKICDEVAIINAGKIIKQGTLESMLTNESAEQLIIEVYEVQR